MNGGDRQAGFLQDAPSDGTTKRICIIGAGAGGLAALKVISETSYCKSGSWKIVAYESRANVGGVWCPAPPTDDPPLTPLYDSLTTNLPHPVMAYTSYPFPPSTPLFPPAATVQTYLESYAVHFNLLPLIQFETTVLNATWRTSHWKVTISTNEILEFDHLIVANGHYRVPLVPDVPGLAHWIREGKAFHSAYYRRPQESGHKVLVVGGGPSGRDISTEMRSYARTVIHSVPDAIPGGVDTFMTRGRPLQFYEDGRVSFEDGFMEEGVDRCILATGFQFSFPFFGEDVMRKGEVPPHPPLPSDLFNSTYHVFPIAKYLFPFQSRYPVNSLAFMTVLIRVVPFPLAEAQAYAIVQAFTDPLSLNRVQEEKALMSRSQMLMEKGASSPLELAKGWFRFVDDEQWDYRDDLFSFAAESGKCRAIKVAKWEKEMYHEKDVLRAAWRDLETRGEAGRWVEGVGAKGPWEWVDMMYRLLKHIRGEDVGCY
ncbi:hypothetical protein F5I97DRAFT_1845845 [Phlebopus sp. FC_14]|nr:hypothetical protein F5I97DRAFT_1845845 [Phlebopus sp. FC_14]